MDDRRKNLLKAVVELYINTAQPVGSIIISNHGDFDVSSATIRNEMMALEEQGYIAQPYTSAGRVPTIKGLKYYLDNLMKIAPVESRILKLMASCRHQDGIKGLARLLAKLSGSAAIVGFGDDEFYYTGFSQLFSQPEFMDSSLVISLGSIVDQLDDLTATVFGSLSTEPTIFLGRGNPFGVDCSALFVSNGKSEETILGLLGPIRTDYQKNIGILKEAVKYLE